jgi:hypothetical protein
MTDDTPLGQVKTSLVVGVIAWMRDVRGKRTAS